LISSGIVVDGQGGRFVCGSNWARFIEQANYQMPPTRCRAKLFSRFGRIAHRYAFSGNCFATSRPIAPVAPVTKVDDFIFLYLDRHTSLHKVLLSVN